MGRSGRKRIRGEPAFPGLAMVKVGRAVGYIDKTGRYIRVL
ncbi:MAG TPA: hypothetical protein P5551_00545 [Syntrophales bacterium]|jgi:hypothetical protein|nr:hypothetical protein [Syntrophales bacterium]HRT60832.1 hypothetical protein [Syntrophales bacterium]